MRDQKKTLMQFEDYIRTQREAFDVITFTLLIIIIIIIIKF